MSFRVSDLVAQGIIQGNSAYATIFYDSANTGYYVDPASNSNIYQLTVNGDHQSGYGIVRVTSSNDALVSLYTGNNATAGLRLQNSSSLDLIFVGKKSGSTDFVVDFGFVGSSEEFIVDSSGNTFSRTSSRAPIFYDSDNTSYYLDPASTSNLNGLQVGGSSVVTNNGGTWNINVTGSSGSTTGNAATATTWQTARTLTIGNTGKSVNGSANVSWSLSEIGALTTDTDSEQTVGGRSYYFNEGVKRMNMDPRWNESGYDADLGTLHIWALTAAGVQYGRAGLALYNGSAYQYITTKASTTGVFVNNTQIVTNSGTWGISVSGTAAGETLATVTGRGASTSTDLTFTGFLTMGTGGTSYIRMGRFPASVTNTGEAWIGRASDRNAGTMTVQLGGNSASSRQFEVVDYAWSSVLFNVSSGGDVTASSSLRAPIFYDSANTSYYLDPNSTTSIRTVGSWRSDSSAWDGEFSGKIQYHSNSWYFQAANLWLFRNSGGSNVFSVTQGGNGVFSGNLTTNGQVYINNGDPTIFLQDTNHRSSMIHCNSNVFYILRGNGTNSTTWATFNGYWPMELNLENNDATFGRNISAPVGTITAGNDMRAPIFYDSNDTTYYADFANSGTSIYTAGIIRSSGVQVKGSSGGGQIYPTMSNGGVSLYGGNSFTNGAYFTVTGIDYASSPGAGSAEFVIRSTATSKFALFSYNGSTWTGRYGLFGSTGNVTIGDANTDIGYRLYVIGDIYATGNIIANSDARIKTNIREIENPLTRVLNTKGVIYDRTDIEEKNSIGFIAQELEKEFPELVSTSTDGRKGVKYQNMVAVLVEAIKEQQKQIDILQSIINK